MRVSLIQSLFPKALARRAGLTCVSVIGCGPTGTAKRTATSAVAGSFALLLLTISPSSSAQDESITLADASLGAAFYADSSCLLTVDSLVQTGKTIIDADVDDAGSRMLIHCDTEQGRRLTLLARGDALNVAQRVPLLTRSQIQEGEFGMIAWLTRAGVNYTDDTVPRRSPCLLRLCRWMKTKWSPIRRIHKLPGQTNKRTQRTPPPISKHTLSLFNTKD